MKCSICILFYGNHTNLAERCLNSVGALLKAGAENVSDVRLGLNEVVWKTDALVTSWAANLYDTTGIPCLIYRPEKNVYKYPLMRRMFHDRVHRPAEWLMWFDDDSYIDVLPGWWDKLNEAAQRSDVVGFVNWYMPVAGHRWKWVTRQPWFNPAIGLPPKMPGFGDRRCFRFTQGAWWLARRDVMWKYDWPCRELRHCGGDSAFGELCRHQRLRLTQFDEGVHVNADEAGDHCKSARRGFTESDLGLEITNNLPDLSHQEFHLICTKIGD